MIDQATIRAVEASIYAAGYPTDAAAALLIELDGALGAGARAGRETVEALCRSNGARTVRVARDEAERAKLWQGRKKAFGAMGRVSAHLVVQDAVVPRTKLPKYWPKFTKLANDIACESATSFTPATAICIRTSHMTDRIPTRRRACTSRWARS
jgi:FAD/FMN-containing dehydrogenase